MGAVRGAKGRPRPVAGLAVRAESERRSREPRRAQAAARGSRGRDARAAAHLDEAAVGLVGRGVQYFESALRLCADVREPLRGLEEREQGVLQDASLRQFVANTSPLAMITRT